MGNTGQVDGTVGGVVGNARDTGICELPCISGAGVKMPRNTRPQVYRVVRKMLPRGRMGLPELLRYLRIRRIATNGPGAPIPSAAPPLAHTPGHPSLCNLQKL